MIFNNLVSLAVVLALFKIQIIFIFGYFLGFSYDPEMGNSTYWGFILLVWGINLFLYLCALYKNPKVSRPEAIVYLFITTLISLHFLWVALDSDATHLAPVLLQQFILLVMPAVFAVKYIDCFIIWRQLIKTSELFFYLMATALTVTHFIPFLAGHRVVGIAGASGQMVSYTAATTFGMLFWHTFLANREYRNKIFISNLVVGVSLVLLSSMVIVLIINGGRGAFVLFLTYVTVYLLWFVKRIVRRRSMDKRWLILVTILPIFILVAYPFLNKNTPFLAGFERVIAFIDLKNKQGFIAWETGTSGRDKVYQRVIEGIIESPWIGHGPFGHWDKVTYPHNLFLDLALQFGVIIALILILALVSLLWRFREPWASHKPWLWMLFLSGFIPIMFSGGYLVQPIVWFCVVGLLLPEKHPSATR